MELSDYAALPAVHTALVDGNRIAAVTAVRTASGCSLPEAMGIVDALWEQGTVASAPSDTVSPATIANPFEPDPAAASAPRDLVFLQVIRQCRPDRYPELLAQLPGGVEQWTDQQRIAAARVAEAFMALSNNLCFQDNQPAWPEYELRMTQAYPDLPAETYSAAYNRSMLSATL